MSTMAKETDKVIYSVEYFNPVGNCDNVVHVEATNEFEAALIAHVDTWSKDKKFDFSDYNVSEYDPEYIIKKEDIFKRKRTSWTPEDFESTLNESLTKWLKDEWKYGYSKTENGLAELADYYRIKSGVSLSVDELKRILELNAAPS